MRKQRRRFACKTGIFITKKYFQHAIHYWTKDAQEQFKLLQKAREEIKKLKKELDHAKRDKD